MELDWPLPAAAARDERMQFDGLRLTTLFGPRVMTCLGMGGMGAGMLLMAWNTFKTITSARAVDAPIPALLAHA